MDGQRISADDIAYKIAPRINAAGRMGSAIDALRLLCTQNTREADELAHKLDIFNHERQRQEKGVLSDAIHEVERTHHFAIDSLIVVAGRNWHRGVLGIVATRLVERYSRPAFVISTDG